MIGRLFGGGTSPEEVSGKIARKDYDGAIRLIRLQLEQSPESFSWRMQLADALAPAGKASEASRLLETLAEELATAGQVAKAVALLKKSQRISPGREGVEEKLASLVQRKEGEAGSNFRAFLRPPPVYGDPSPSAQATAGPAAPPGVPARTGAPVVLTPLFGEFSQAELVAVIRGLTLQSFDPGDIIVTQGEPGGSLFILTTGRVKAFVRNPSGKNVKVRELGEGDFFGEISVLTGTPRTATVVAATNCDLLELDRGTLDTITAAHPHVRTVMEQFYRERSGASGEQPRSAATKT
jgi:cAMP-dependent protein kinase regulator